MKTYRGKTKQGDEWYGDLGAMRFPGVEGQPIINKVLSKLALFNFYFKFEFQRFSKSSIYPQQDLLISM